MLSPAEASRLEKNQMSVQKKIKRVTLRANEKAAKAVAEADASGEYSVRHLTDIYNRVLNEELRKNLN